MSRRGRRSPAPPDGSPACSLRGGVDPNAQEDPGAAAAARIKAAAPAKEEADPRQEEARRKLREEQAKKCAPLHPSRARPSASPPPLPLGLWSDAE